MPRRQRLRIGRITPGNPYRGFEFPRGTIEPRVFVRALLAIELGGHAPRDRLAAATAAAAAGPVRPHAGPGLGQQESNRARGATTEPRPAETAPGSEQRRQRQPARRRAGRHSGSDDTTGPGSIWPAPAPGVRTGLVPTAGGAAPARSDAALRVAAGHTALCPDNVFQEAARPAGHAASPADADSWFPWWD
ncbi:hypothetical protein KNE206_65510 [Kitasatospora sp. NE20-6]|uniref:DUF6420 family protein n=1 Tax=Kitasatospora sp. NE20-6 TaxID=2859066 RepID=UPI0034DC392B